MLGIWHVSPKLRNEYLKRRFQKTGLDSFTPSDRLEPTNNLIPASTKRTRCILQIIFQMKQSSYNFANRQSGIANLICRQQTDNYLILSTMASGLINRA